MKQKAFILFFLALLLSCSDSNQKLLPNSSGNINNISVVSSETSGKGRLEKLSEKILLDQSMVFHKLSLCLALVTFQVKYSQVLQQKSRTILKIDISETEGVFNFKNTYASPQRIIQVTGSTPEKIITTIKSGT